MDNKGFISIQYIFYIFLLILIATSILFIATASFSSTESIEKHLSFRIVLDDVCDDINEVNSNGEGYSKKITLPSKISGNNYVLEVCKNKVVFKGGGRIAQNAILPINLVKNNVKVDKIDLNGGQSYIITKHENSTISIGVF